MNDELTTQGSPAPIVLKLKKYDDIILPHTSRLSTDSLNDSSSSSFIPNAESPLITTISPPTLRVKFKKSFINGSDDEYTNSNSPEISARPAKRSRKSLSNDNISDLNNEQISSQQEMNQIKPEQSSFTSPLILKIRRDSFTSTVETETNRQLLIKLKKNEYGELITTTNPNDISSNLINNNNEYTNGHNDITYQPLNHETKTPIQPHITNMLSNLNDDKQWNNHHTTTDSHVPMDITPTPAIVPSTTETHTKELLDEALDSVKNVLMETFKKNLEAGGDLNALKSSLGSDEVAEVFLSKLRESLKRETISTIESEQKTPEHTSTNTEIRSSQTLVPSTSNTIISPIMNVVSSPSSILPSISTMVTKTTVPPTIVNNNKRKFSTSLTNPNRFDGTTEDELTKRVLSDILQPNLDIVFVGINPSLYAVHKGHHYGGPGNHFWKLLHMSDLIPNAFTTNDDYLMPQYGIGFTNIVQRPSKAGSDITKDEIMAGAEVLIQKIKMYRPKIVAFNGRGIYEVYAGNKHFHYGKQPDLFSGTDTHVFVMPSSSARCSQLPRAEDKLPFYIGLKKLRDFVNGTLYSLNEAEITFPDIKIKDIDDVLQKTIIRISNKPFSELSLETLKPYGDKIPSGQMISKQISSSNTNTLTTQTMSILNNNEQNGNLLNYDHQRSTINGIISSSKTSFRENTSSTTAINNNNNNNADAALLAALNAGSYSSSSPTQQQSQTIYVGRQQQSVSYSGSSPLNNNFSSTNSRSSTPTSFSHTIHYPPQSPYSIDDQTQPINSQIVSHQLVVLNPNERLTSTDPILNSTLSKDFSSSQHITQKQTFTIPTNPSPSTTNLPKTSLPSEKFANHTTDDCLFLRYERESSSIQNSFHFSYVIDESSSSIPKHLRYVSINDL